LDGAQKRVIERPDLGVTLSDVAPSLLGQLDLPAVGIID
jgi:hypothetical protein